ncbi:MAG: hypothetical protein A2269_08770 [Lentisphaerae bacterium RIFOXYA12_FULL_60_10]|nr:MAG: hypothetical protein A2269_08770 [Lentisphaerae bacterium RIFOXYA12_FULL_60_10]
MLMSPTGQACLAPVRLLILITGWAVIGATFAGADTLVLKNGQTLTGQVKGKANALVIFLPDGESKTRMIDAADIAEIRKGTVDTGNRSQDEVSFPANTDTPSVGSPLDDARFENSIVQAGRKAGVPEDRTKIRELMHKRWIHACTIPSNKWNAMTASLLGRGINTNVNHNHPEDKDAQIKYRLNGEWVFSNDPPSNSLPTSDAGITECWQKTYSSTRSDGMLTWYSTDPRAFSNWRKLTWDRDQNRWVFTTLEARRTCVTGFRKWLDTERDIKRKEVAQGPHPGNLKWAGDYAQRMTVARRKLADGPASEKEARALEFTIQSAGKNAYERLVMAFDPEFEYRALEQFRSDFNQRDPLAPEAWKR